LKVPTEEQLQEIHRLAVLGHVAAIAQDVGPRLTGPWLATSRFREVREVSLQTLALGPHARTLVDLARAKRRLGEVQDALAHYRTALHLYTTVGDRAGLAATLNNIGLVYNGLGDRQQALTYYQKALPIAEEVGDRAGLAATLNNIGLVYNGLGDRQQALTYYQKALPIAEEVGDRAGESVTWYNLAMIYRVQGQFAEAVAALRQVVALDQQVQHPDLESDQAMLHQVEQEWRESLQ
jgi:tetratricopeptide (TPR) repeat protein